jgi:hypothetical protein
LSGLPFSLLYEIITQGYLRIDSEDSLYDFISKGIETSREMFSLLEFVRLEYCSTGVMNDFFDLLSDYCYEINASMWASLRARLVLPNRNKKMGKQFPPLLKRGRYFAIPDGIIAHLTRECGGNVYDRKIVAVTAGSFERTTEKNKANPKQVADLGSGSSYWSDYRSLREYIPHTRNNWICYDFKERRIVPTHYTIRTHDGGPGWSHLKSWLVETSADGESWREVSREENTEQLTGPNFTGTFAVAGGGECRFIRLVNIGRNHYGYDILRISAWEIFGGLVE